MPPVLLLVDDEPAVLDPLSRFLAHEGYDVRRATNGDEALRILQREPIAVCVADVCMDGIDGFELLHRARGLQMDTAFVLMSGHATLDSAVAALRAGASDFLTKPFGRNELLGAVSAALRRRDSGVAAAPAPRDSKDARHLIGNSHGMRQIGELIDRVGPSDATVLIQGESGTGKEVVAAALRSRSRRHDAPYIKVNSAAIPDALMESELFGYDKGAFTGAIKAKKGRFELAHGGTIFLDEIGDMSPSTQMKVLRVLQEGEFDRVGGTRTQKVDVRVIAATNVNLEKAIAEKRFPEDLYYRLRVIEVRIPPLRDRKEDIPLLVDHFVRQYASKDGKRIDGLEPDAIGMLLDYDWPGNVRELENAIERAVVMARGTRITCIDLAPELQRTGPRAFVTFTVGTTLDEIERRMIHETLRFTGGDKTRAAALLGITARTIYRKLESQRSGLDVDTGASPPAGSAEPVSPAAATPESAAPAATDPHLDGLFAQWLAQSDPENEVSPPRLDTSASN